MNGTRTLALSSAATALVTATMLLAGCSPIALPATTPP